MFWIISFFEKVSLKICKMEFFTLFHIFSLFSHFSPTVFHIFSPTVFHIFSHYIFSHFHPCNNMYVYVYGIQKNVPLTKFSIPSSASLQITFQSQTVLLLSSLQLFYRWIFKSIIMCNWNAPGVERNKAYQFILHQSEIFKNLKSIDLRWNLSSQMMLHFCIIYIIFWCGKTALM